MTYMASLPEPVREMITNDHAPTAPLKAFRHAYDQDDNVWWMLSCGHHQNLLDEALGELDQAHELIERLREQQSGD
jgi:hypothetical protein